MVDVNVLKDLLKLIQVVLEYALKMAILIKMENVFVYKVLQEIDKDFVYKVDKFQIIVIDQMKYY
jgi:hypothetical protein